MIAAFDFVPGVAPYAVMTRPYRLDDLQPFIDPALADQMRRDLVFDTGPDLIGIRKGQARASALGKGAEQQAGFIIQRVNPLGIDVLAEVIQEVIVMDRLQRRANVFGWQ